jgi:hypothetical protein
VAAWRNVPASVVDAAVETRSMALRQLNDEPPSTAWLPPEWAAVAPAMSRYWRRRRARRRMTDPDTQPSPAADAQATDAPAAGRPHAELEPGPP